MTAEKLAQSRDSRPAAAVFLACCYAGPERGQSVCEHWRRFEFEYLIAHARGNLLQAAHEVAERLRRDRIEATRDNVRGSLILAVGMATAAIAPQLDDATVERLIDVTVEDFLKAAVAA